MIYQQKLLMREELLLRDMEFGDCMRGNESIRKATNS
jgi:hypothetical protein